MKTRSGSGKPTGQAELSFRERALVEAARYGSDSWVFLRELLQNARDAGAHRVDLTVSESDNLERLVCRDDGSGMSAVHAHRYLFALYASSKEGDIRQAGQFGVGFWSVLRFQPEKVTIRSKPRQGEAWQVDLNHRLDNAVFTSCKLAGGTEIILERQRAQASGEGLQPTPAPLADQVHDAVFRYGRFLTRREEAPRRWRRRRWRRRGHQGLVVTVNGRPVADEMTLPAPSASFRRQGFRGIVALAAEPRVELFANGLFVRQTTCLEDLVADPVHDDQADGSFSLDLPGTLAPHVLLDSSRLELLLARSDVRQSRHLEHMVKTAEKELEGLIERQLEIVHPRSWFHLIWARGRQWLHRLSAWRKIRLFWWLAPVAVLGVLLGWALAGWTTPRPDDGAWGLGLRTWNTEPADMTVANGRPWRRFLSDLGRSYQGPRLDPMEASTESFELVYEPANKTLFLTALVVEDPSSWSSAGARNGSPNGPYSGATCQADDCIRIRLIAGKGDLRLPVPTGHLLDPASVRVDDTSRPVYATASGQPQVLGLKQGDQLKYRTVPAGIPESYRPKTSSGAPSELTALAARLHNMPEGQRVEEAVQQVARLVRYDRSAEAVQQHRAEIDARRGFAEAALKVGKGDCDVQNGVLALLLQEAGVSARLAVGYVGQNGKVAPALHAWVEYRGTDGRWHVADASTRSAPVGTSSLAWVTGSTESGTGHLGSANMVLLAPGPRTGKASSFPSFGLSTTSKSTSRRLLLGTSIAVCLALVWTRARRQRESRQRTQLAETDLAALLGGALRHPGLSRMPSLLHGRLIPLIARAESRPSRGIRRGAISLHEAQKRAGQGLLFSSVGTSPLARTAAARNWPVIDTSQAEGRVTSLGLGAIDLDEWSDLLDRGATSGLVEYLNEYLDDIGQDWRLVLSSPLSQPLKIIDLSLLGLGRRQVLIDPHSADFSPVGPRQGIRGAAAAFRLLDAVVDHLDLTRSERGKLLAEMARRAVVEEHGS